MRAEAAATAVARIVSSLLGGGSAAIGELAAAVAAGAPAVAAGSPAAASGAPAVSSVAPAPAPGSGVWLDSALCTSCDECVRKYPSIFVYDSDKQATIKNPRGGSFRDLVRAAEACPARVIHPGEPWNVQEKDLAAWVERARKFD